MSVMKEFKEFALKGNVLDLAVGVIIGAAFGKLVSSLVEDIIMPPLGLLLGHVDFSNLFIDLSGKHYESLSEAKKAGAATINYGLFFNNTISLILVAVAVFILIKQVNRLRRKPDPPAPNTKNCPFCITTIALQAKRCPNCTSQLEGAAGA